MQPKYAFPVCTEETRSKALAWSGESGAVFAKLKRMGYDGVELFVRDPRELDPGRIDSLLAENGLTAAAVGTGQLLAEDKLHLTHEDAVRRKDAVERGKAVVDFAAVLKSQVNIGKFRGDVGGSAEKRAWMDEGIRAIAGHAHEQGVLVTIEPQSRIGCDNCNTTQQALAWLHALGLPNLRLMLDVYHMQIDDACIPASFIEARDATVHVHFADTNRGCPGSGGIDFAMALRVLKALNYDRFITMEISQTPDSETAARRSLEYVKTLASFIWP